MDGTSEKVSFDGEPPVTLEELAILAELIRADVSASDELAEPKALMPEGE